MNYPTESDTIARDWLVRPGDVAMDVGTCEGAYTIAALSAGASFVYSWPAAEGADPLLRWLAANESRTRCAVADGPLGRLDDFLASSGIEHCEWLKLDVEGAEVEVLKGAEHLIRALRPTILVENHLFQRNTIAEEVRSLLGDMGYRHISTHQNHSVSHSVYRAKSS